MTLLICWVLEDIILCVKNWFRCRKYFAAVIERIPPPKGNVDEPLQALIFDPTIHFG
jgi:GTP-binding protein LepA